MDRHRDSLHRMIRMRLDRAIASRVDASDVVQDVLLEASERLDDYIRDPKVPFHLWLRQLAKDRMIDMHRRHRGAQRRSVDREQSFQATNPNDDESRKEPGILSAGSGTHAGSGHNPKRTGRTIPGCDFIAR